MKLGKSITPLLKSVSMMGGTIALIGIVVGLFFQILPEHNIFIRCAEICFFSLCIPILLGAAWQNLKMIKCSLSHLKLFLVILTVGLFFLLVKADQTGGILSYEFLAVIVLTMTIIVIVVAGAEPIKRALVKINPFSTN